MTSVTELQLIHLAGTGPFKKNLILIKGICKRMPFIFNENFKKCLFINDALRLLLFAFVLPHA